MSYNEIVTWSDRVHIDSLYPQDDWNPLLYSSSVGEVEAAPGRGRSFCIVFRQRDAATTRARATALIF